MIDVDVARLPGKLLAGGRVSLQGMKLQLHWRALKVGEMEFTGRDDD